MLYLTTTFLSNDKACLEKFLPSTAVKAYLPTFYLPNVNCSLKHNKNKKISYLLAIHVLRETFLINMLMV